MAAEGAPYACKCMHSANKALLLEGAKRSCHTNTLFHMQHQTNRHTDAAANLQTAGKLRHLKHEGSGSIQAQETLKQRTEMNSRNT